MSGTRVLIFVDNEAAKHGLIRGSSASPDGCDLVEEFWDLALTYHLDVWVERVPSQSNRADGPSRLKFSDLDDFRECLVQHLRGGMSGKG